MHKPHEFVIWGSAGHSKVLNSILAMRGDVVVALFDNSEVEASIPGVLIYIGHEGFLTWKSTYGNVENVSALVAIGGGRGRERLAIQKLFLRNGFKTPWVAHQSAFICKTASIGAGTQVMAQAVVAAGTRIGEACIINNHASVDHECELRNGVHVAPGAILCGCVNVDDNAFIGAGSVILPGREIGRDSIIGAGSVVTRDIKAGSTVAGNPARIIKSY